MTPSTSCRRRSCMHAKLETLLWTPLTEGLETSKTVCKIKREVSWLALMRVSQISSKFRGRPQAEKNLENLGGSTQSHREFAF